MKPIAALIAFAIFITAGVTALPAPIRDKTLVAWVCPSNLTQQGSGVLTLIDNAEHFDAIVFGEVARGKWMAGSDFFRRTHQDQASWPLETAGSNSLVQLAITYRGNRVTLFRNGKEYAAYSMGQPQAFGDDATVLLGLRYLSASDETGFFSGSMERWPSSTPMNRKTWVSACSAKAAKWRSESSGAGRCSRPIPGKVTLNGPQLAVLGNSTRLVY